MSRKYTTSAKDGVGNLTPPLSDYVNIYALTADTAETVVWPEGMTHCNIVGVSGTDYYVRADGNAATVPSTDVTDGTGSARNVAQRSREQDEASFSVISASDTVLTIEFWGE